MRPWRSLMRRWSIHLELNGKHIFKPKPSPDPRVLYKQDNVLVGTRLNIMLRIAPRKLQRYMCQLMHLRRHTIGNVKLRYAGINPLNYAPLHSVLLGRIESNDGDCGGFSTRTMVCLTFSRYLRRIEPSLVHRKLSRKLDCNALVIDGPQHIKPLWVNVTS